jgi:hypothetical protein
MHRPGRTHSIAQSAAELPYWVHRLWNDWIQVRPSGAEVVAAPPRLTPLDVRRGTMSFIQYWIASLAATLDWLASLGSLKKSAFLTVDGQLDC